MNRRRILLGLFASTSAGAAQAQAIRGQLLRLGLRGQGGLPPAPQNLSLPTIVGSTVVGEDLVFYVGGWAGVVTSYAIQVRRGGVDVGAPLVSTGAAVSRANVSGDSGALITAVVTATGPGGASTATAAAVGPIQAGGTPAAASLATGISGIEFDFSQAVQVGQFAGAGYYWVNKAGAALQVPAARPLAVTNMSGIEVTTPYTGRTAHGLMKNPGNAIHFTSLSGQRRGDRHGWDSLADTGCTYAAGLNVDPAITGAPITIAAGEEATLVKAISFQNPPRTQRQYLSDLYPLTILNSAPAADAIRPGVSSSGTKVIRGRRSTLNMSIFPTLDHVTGMPTLAEAMALVDRYQQNNAMRNPGYSRTLSPINNHREYAQFIGYDNTQAASVFFSPLYTTEQKRDLAAMFAELACDVLERVKEGGVTEQNGGNAHGWKMILGIGGLLMGDAEMMEWFDHGRRPGIFQEDLATSTITLAQCNQWPYIGAIEGDGIHERVEFVANNNRRHSRHTYPMIGIPDWGEGSYIDNAKRHGSNFNSAYRQISGSVNFQEMVIAKLIPGMEAAWNYPAFFNYYYRRYWSRNRYKITGVTNYIQPWAWNLYDQYLKPTGGVAPVLQSVQLDETREQIWLMYDKPLEEVNIPVDYACFAVLRNGVPLTIKPRIGYLGPSNENPPGYAAGFPTNGVEPYYDRVKIHLTAPVPAKVGADTLTVAYTRPAAAAERLQDLEGNPCASFTAQSVPF